MKIPTEMITLPSEGKAYPENSPLASGVVEMKYMTAAEEDILSNYGFIEDGSLIDRLIKSMMVQPQLYDQLLLGDQSSLLYAARVLGFGGEYAFNTTCPKCKSKFDHTVDLNALETSGDPNLLNRENLYSVVLPVSGYEVKFKLLTVADNRLAERAIEGAKKIGGNPIVSEMLRQSVVEVSGGKIKVGEFIPKAMAIRDSKFLQKEINRIMPNVNTDVEITCPSCGEVYTRSLPVQANFFYPTDV